MAKPDSTIDASRPIADVRSAGGSIDLDAHGHGWTEPSGQGGLAIVTMSIYLFLKSSG